MNYTAAKSKRLYRYITHSLDLEFLVLIVGRACNLKCKDCGNFCPDSPLQMMRYDVESIIGHLEIILKNVQYIDCLQIQGGEPFLYSDLPELLAFLRRQRKIKSIWFASNGMVQPSDLILNEIKKDDRVKISISDYKLSEFPEKLSEHLGEMGIPVEYYDFAGHTGEWTDLGGIDIVPVDDAEAKEHFATCAFNGCLTLEDGELSYCSRATNAYRLQGFMRKPDDYLTVSDEEGFKDKLREFVRNRHTMEACRYCNGTMKGEKIKPAVQKETGGQQTEWK